MKLKEKLTDAYVDVCQRSEPPIELPHLFLKALPPSTGQRRLEDPPTRNDINFYPYLSLASYTILSGFFVLIFSPFFKTLYGRFFFKGRYRLFRKIETTKWRVFISEN